MSVLVLAEHDNKSLKGATLNAVAAAQKIGGDVHVLVAGATYNLHTREAYAGALVQRKG